MAVVDATPYVVFVEFIVTTPLAFEVTVVAPVPLIVTDPLTVVLSAIVTLVFPLVVLALAAVPVNGRYE